MTHEAALLRIGRAGRESVARAPLERAVGQVGQLLHHRLQRQEAGQVAYGQRKRQGASLPAKRRGHGSAPRLPARASLSAVRQASRASVAAISGKLSSCNLRKGEWARARAIASVKSSFAMCHIHVTA